jgi:hypothetical protein
MQLQQRINAFQKLGEFLASEALSDHDLIRRASQENGWFTEDNIKFALHNWSLALSKENIKNWLANYSFSSEGTKTIAVIMAGNIPLVGFHDFISVLISGHRLRAKLSSKDTILLPHLAEILQTIEPGFKGCIQFTEEKLKDFDAVIATGSNNTARYFEYYFGKYPNIIRKNRNSVAVLSGKENNEQLEALANDVFRYFGLGCRNVSKIFLPENYDFEPFFKAMFSWKHVIDNHKYINNYDYNKAVYLMSNIQLLDNEFMILKEDTGFSSPISVLFYEYYRNTTELRAKLRENSNEIQAIVAHVGIENEIDFGVAQKPQLWDYADGVDTLSFLLKLS